jgi:hypothetical protein
MFVQSRYHGRQRVRFYMCSAFHHRGSRVCPNNQALPMARIDQEVLAAFRDDLLHPAVIERALAKLRKRLEVPVEDRSERRHQLVPESQRLDRELIRLSDALADGAPAVSVMAAIREREQRRAALASELTRLDAETTPTQALDVAMSEAQRRIDDWRTTLSQATTQARGMLRVLLENRLVLTPRPEVNKVELSGRGNFGRVLEGLIPVSQAMASPTGSPRVGPRRSVEVDWVLLAA